MKRVLLISENYLKTHSYINDNLESAFLTPSIITAQELGLQPVLGTNLYETLLEKVSSGEISKPEAANYKELLDEYIIPYLAFKVLEDIQIPLNYKFRNSGMSTNVDPGYVAAHLREVQELIDYYANKNKFYANRISDFLCANSSKFPEYKTRENKSDLRPDNMSYRTGIFLD